MRLALALFLAIPLLAQPAAPPTPSSEPWLTGSLDLGYRFTTTAGDDNVYRSVVNLSQGPRLFGLDFTIIDPQKRYFDRLDVRANNWGGDPYNTAQIDASKRGIYDFRFNYRDIAYFNFLPSYADPLLGAGVVLDENSYFTRRKVADFQLDLLPGHRIIPYFAYGRDWGDGTGITTFVSDINVYSVADHIFDKTDNYRGGVRFELNRFHATLEQGGTTLSDEQQISNAAVTYGNIHKPFFGQTLFLDSLAQAYGISGDSIYTKALVTANPFPWVDVSGQFLYSQPQTSVNYAQANTGNFVLVRSLLFYTGEQALAFATAKQPHTAGSVGLELRPWKRLRILESWSTDRLHTAAAGLFTDMILQPASAAQTLPTELSSLLAVNYNQEEIDALVEVTRWLTLRGGYRYVWGDAQTGNPLTVNPGQESSELRQNIGIGGINLRVSQKLSANVDIEGGATDQAYFRTSLYDYQRMRARARYQVTPKLSLQATFSLLNNQNPTPGINYDFLSRQTSVSASWTPSKRVSILGDYTRSTLRSNIGYLEPSTLRPGNVSLYRDDAHSATSLVDLALPGYSGLKPRLAVGGSLFISSGSRPTRFYQPLARLSVPLHKNVAWNSEWRYYGYGEPFYLYEAFRAHIIETGVRLSR